MQFEESLSIPDFDIEKDLAFSSGVQSCVLDGAGKGGCVARRTDASPSVHNLILPLTETLILTSNLIPEPCAFKSLDSAACARTQNREMHV